MLDRKKLKMIAAKLDGRTYDDFAGYKLSKEVAEIMDMAADEGIVVLYGASDDLVEFDGAFQDEAGCFGSGTITFDERGTSDDGNVHANKLQVRWQKDFDENRHLIDFTYILDIPHETFMIYDEGYPYCRGLVFFASEMRRPRD